MKPAISIALIVCLAIAISPVMANAMPPGVQTWGANDDFYFGAYWKSYVNVTPAVTSAAPATGGGSQPYIPVIFEPKNFTVISYKKMSDIDLGIANYTLQIKNGESMQTINLYLSPNMKEYCEFFSETGFVLEAMQMKTTNFVCIYEENGTVSGTLDIKGEDEVITLTVAATRTMGLLGDLREFLIDLQTDPDSALNSETEIAGFIIPTWVVWAVIIAIIIAILAVIVYMFIPANE